MRRLWLLAALTGCTASGKTGVKGSDVADDPGTTTPTSGDGTTTTPPPTTTPPSTTPAPTDCAADPTLQVLSATATAGLVTTLVSVDVELSAPASVAVQCTSDLDPTEIFLGEDAAVSASHTVHLEGLLPSSTWSCTAAPTCPTLAGPPASFTYETGVPPADIAKVTVETDPVLGMGGAWTLVPYTFQAFNGTTWLVIYGPDGRLRWWWPTDDGVGMWLEVKYDVAAKDFVWGGGMSENGRPHVLDFWNGVTYTWAPPGWQDVEFHHDGKRLDDGRIMTLEIRDNTNGPLDWDGFGLRVHDPVSGSIDFDFDSQALVDAGELAPPDNGFDSDPWHANWMDWKETPSGPEAFVSLCLAWQMLALDGTDGHLLWLLGRGLGWTVLDDLGNDIGEDALPQCQHGLEVNTDGDTFLVYDNGQDRSFSSAEEWKIDAAAHTATRLWMWTEPGWQEDYIGDIDYLPNDRILVTEAAQFGVAEIAEVDRATGTVASRMTWDKGGYIYRSERYEGCDLFTSVKNCDALATRYTELAPLLAP